MNKKAKRFGYVALVVPIDGSTWQYRCMLVHGDSLCNSKHILDKLCIEHEEIWNIKQKYHSLSVKNGLENELINALESIGGYAL